MNKTEKLICVLLGLALVGYFMWNANNRPQPAATAPAAPAAERPAAAAPAPQPALPAAPAAPAALPDPAVPERVAVLSNDVVRLEFSSWGAEVRRATLLGYATKVGAIGPDNPPLALDFADAPLGRLEIEGLAPNAAYEVKSVTSNAVVFACGPVTRTYTLGAGYVVTLEESFADESLAQKPNRLSLGALSKGSGRLDMLSVDSWDPARNDGRGEVVHHDEGESPLKAYLAGGAGGGCSSGSGGDDKPAVKTVAYPAPQKWIALKNRFFVTALTGATRGEGADAAAENPSFEATIRRDASAPAYAPGSGTVRAVFAGAPAKRTCVFYVGPKKQAVLSDLGLRDVMEFGMWRVICYPLVWILNACYDVIPSYGVAIILLTVLVRLVFWPLTHKSTVGMRRMQELQPRLKELQAKFKGNPQRLQQETWALYRENKVNPLSSCLPMLIQIPVFVALFNVLRTAVELRYAGFLWIDDLSEPERLFLEAFSAIGGLNILPILMAATMALQSWLTPSTGDRSQKKMMVVLMPAMMLFMFYSFPSALSLYWTLSQVFSIVQMWLIRRQTAQRQPAVAPTEVIDPPVTRQMKRHQ